MNKEVKKSIRKIAGKLIAEGLKSKDFTKAKAKKLTKDVVAPVYVHKMIDRYSKEIKESMQKMEK